LSLPSIAHHSILSWGSSLPKAPGRLAVGKRSPQPRSRSPAGLTVSVTFSPSDSGHSTGRSSLLPPGQRGESRPGCGQGPAPLPTARSSPARPGSCRHRSKAEKSRLVSRYPPEGLPALRLSQPTLRTRLASPNELPHPRQSHRDL